MSIYDKVKEDPEWKQLSEGTGRLYVLVRGDLTKSQQAVQAGHAIAQFCLTRNQFWMGDIGPVAHWKNEYLILLRVEDHTELLVWRERLRAKGILFAEFREPDLDNQTTAVATFGDNVKDLLRDIPLL